MTGPSLQLWELHPGLQEDLLDHWQQQFGMTLLCKDFLTQYPAIQQKRYGAIFGGSIESEDSRSHGGRSW